MLQRLLIFLSMLLHFAVRSQAHLYSVNDGLSNKDITCVLQTRDGLMWIGTANGLNLFDGYNFREYNIANGLSNGRIYCLHEDDDGWLWIGTWDGLNILNRSTGEIKTFFSTPNVTGPRMITSHIYCITRHVDGSVFVSLGDGSLYRFSDRSNFNKVFVLAEKDSLYEHYVASMAMDQDGSIFYCDNFGGAGKLNKRYALDTTFKTDVKYVDFNFMAGQQPKVHLINAWGDLYQADHKTGKTHCIREMRPRYNNSHVFSVFSEQGSDDIWVAYSEGNVERVNVHNVTSESYLGEIQNVLTGASVYVYKDRTGTAWVGTNYGLIRFFPNHHHFSNYLKPADRGFKFRNSVRGMTEDKNGDIYVGGYNGLFRISPSTGEEFHFDFPELGDGRTHAYYPYRLLNDTGYIWLTSETSGFYRFNKRRKKIEFNFAKCGKDVSFFQAFAMAGDKGDTIWVGTHNGLFVYSKRANTITRFESPDPSMQIRKMEISDLALGSGHRLFIGGYTTGVFLLDWEHKSLKHFSKSNGALPHNFVTVIKPENDSILWVGTRGGGLACLNILTGRSTVYLKSDGLADNLIAGIQIDEAGNKWVSTFNGLSKIDVKTGHIENYYDKDGLSDNEFNTAASYRSSTGRMYFGGTNGVNAFYPADLRKTMAIRPRILITRFTKFDGKHERLVEQAFSPGAAAVDIGPDDKFFSFSLALDDYYNPTRNVFLYQLEGFESEWNNIGSQNVIRFNTLPAGSYVLRIKGINSDGLSSANEIRVPLHVRVAFYKSPWFTFFVVLVIIALVYLGLRYHFKQQLKLQHLRTKISSDLHDEVGSLLTRITIQSDMVGHETGGQTREDLLQIAKTSRQAIAAMNDVLWTVDARNDDAGNLITRMKELAGEVLFPLDIAVEFNVDGLDETAHMDGNTRQEIFLIFKEAINNIARHSNATEVRIALQQHGSHFTMYISDNGIVSGVSSRQSGQGIKNMRMRAERLRGKLIINNTYGYSVQLSIQKRK